MITDSYFLIPAVIAQIFNLTAVLVIPAETPTIEAKAELETQPLTTEMKGRYFSSLNSSLVFSFALFVFKVLLYYLVIIFIVIR